MKYFAVRELFLYLKIQGRNIIKNQRLLEQIIQKQIGISGYCQHYFTATRDVDAAYPAVSARELGMTSIP